MSQKRKHEESSSSRNDVTKPTKKHKPDFKPGNPYNRSKGKNVPKLEPKANATGALKSRIRDLKRLLEHVDNEPKYKMPANVRIERERELETCEHELEEKLAAAREAEFRSKMIGKYHQVRFFDRQKATRILKRLQKELSTLDDQSKKAELERKIHNAEVDVNYAMYYPLMKPYSSLYPKSKREQSKSAEPGDEMSKQQQTGQPDGAKGDPEMWRAIEKAMKEDTLDALRNSTTGAPLPQPKKKEKKQSKKQKKQQQTGVLQGMLNETKAAAVQAEDEDSDGGFFE